eukprot:CAMPEP_0119269244 /NCGR_PEP_ID=MMETSP1329-20130426/6729_1 /TAXON_ID=114041 /ORGANISM="Genus nov. species nov., Strain RCC1024" /LENGTH=535 /DNA_ID=CAMNT_0007269241 /DNA_START=229 /DNA_END=1836 /DNA_ORIENTATION=-
MTPGTTPDVAVPQAVDDGRRAVIGNTKWLSHAPDAYFAHDKLKTKGLRANTDVGNPIDASRPLVKVGDVGVGAWSCTEGGWLSPAPRASTEFFIMLEGEGSVDDEDGTRHRFGPGDVVVLPKGWAGRWDVTKDLRKVWAVHTHEDVAGASTTAVVATPDSLDWVPKGARADAARGAPTTASASIYDVGSTKVGCWSCTPGSFEVKDRPTTESFYVLDGEAFLTNEDGTATRVVAGDTVVLPKGWSGRWDVLETIKKVWVVVGDGSSGSAAPAGAPAKARRPIVGGNWKCNPADVKELDALVANINACDTKDCDVYVCPSNLHVGMVYDKFTNGALVAPQNCNFKGCGAYTGEMAVDQMKSMGMKWVLIGHSERRGEFDLPIPVESNELLATKLAYVLEQGLNCILAIGEPLPVREKGIDAVMENLIPQLECVKDLLSAERVVIAYEPVWSIGTGVTASPEQAQETHAAIRAWIRANVSPAVADGIRIQYGGSANAANAPALSAMPDVDGFLVGGASLKPEFADIVAAISAAKVAA